MDRTGRNTHKVKLFREFDPTPGDGEVPDPYYGGQQGFEDVYQMCLRTSAAILNQLER
jgi:protein-tyrosine phosphatase